ncbi:MAG: alpha/beta fold hydrolase [Chloroflexi bacterium]|nr:alpha/beta fold hydrolase [Chloroflexota bacterium]
MPYVDNSGVKIHYHVEGDGPPLVMQHGLTSSLKNWYAYGFVEELQKDYRLILVDARGHGRSDKPHDPKDYDLKLRVSDILAVMDDVGVDKAHYMGYSMGGRIGFGLVLHAIDRLHSLIIGGMSANTPNSDTPPEDRINLLRQGMAAYVANTEANEGPMEAGRKERLLENDPEALIAATTAPRGTDGLEALLPGLNLPCLLYCGEADGFFPGAKEAAQAIPGAVFVPLPGLDHGQASRAGEQVLPHVAEFLKDTAMRVGAAS